MKTDLEITVQKIKVESISLDIKNSCIDIVIKQIFFNYNEQNIYKMIYPGVFW